MDKKNIIQTLSKVFDLELSGVIRYTHYSLMIFGPNRLPLIDFFKAQASESLTHANLAGEYITGLGGHPPLGIGNIEDHNIWYDITETLQPTEFLGYDKNITQSQIKAIIFNQKNIEIIVVNDGSNDKSQNILNELKKNKYKFNYKLINLNKEV